MIAVARNTRKGRWGELLIKVHLIDLAGQLDDFAEVSGYGDTLGYETAGG